MFYDRWVRFPLRHDPMSETATPLVQCLSQFFQGFCRSGTLVPETAHLDPSRLVLRNRLQFRHNAEIEDTQASQWVH